MFLIGRYFDLKSQGLKITEIRWDDQNSNTYLYIRYPIGIYIINPNNLRIKKAFAPLLLELEKLSFKLDAKWKVAVDNDGRYYPLGEEKRIVQSLEDIGICIFAKSQGKVDFL